MQEKGGSNALALAVCDPRPTTAQQRYAFQRDFAELPEAVRTRYLQLKADSGPGKRDRINQIINAAVDRGASYKTRAKTDEEPS